MSRTRPDFPAGTGPIGTPTVIGWELLVTSLDGQRLVNGERVTVKAITRDGTLYVDGPDGVEKQLGREHRVFELGYAVTSYGSQGRTVDAVLLADAGLAAASHKKEWYVSMSRARRNIAVFTPDAEGLAERICASGDGMLGIELLPDTRDLVQTGLRSLIHDSLQHAQRAVTAIHSRIHL